MEILYMWIMELTIHQVGEEFIIILRGEDINGAKSFAELARRIIADEICVYDGDNIKVTMSFGVSVLSANKTIEENIKEADDRLYEAKKTGRNKVM